MNNSKSSNIFRMKKEIFQNSQPQSRAMAQNRSAYFLKKAKEKQKLADRALKLALDKGRREMQFDSLHKMGEACEIARQLNLPIKFSAFKGADGALKIYFIKQQNNQEQVQDKQLISIQEFMREYKRLKRMQSSVNTLMKGSSVNTKMSKMMKSKQKLNQIMPVISATCNSAIVPFTSNSLGKISKKERQEQLKSVLQETMKLTNQLKEQLRILQKKGVCKLQKNFNSSQQASIV